MKKITIIALLFFVVFVAIALQRNNIDEDIDTDETTELVPDINNNSSSIVPNSNNSEIQTDESSDISESNSNNEFEIPAPLTDRPEQIIHHTGYTLSYNKSHNTPNWSAWELTSEKTLGTISRCKKFWADPEISTLYRVDYYEYKGSGYDRGHMCPAADMKWSSDAMHDCFYMSNMCPQDPSLNSGSWKELEETCRDWALREGIIYIVCGPVYEGTHHEQIGIEHAIDVPEGFFKAVLSLKKGQEKAIGFYYDNSSKHQSISSTAMSVDEIERRTGMDLFFNLNDKLENKIESQFSLSDW